jgi:hypothetical protein
MMSVECETVFVRLVYRADAGDLSQSCSTTLKREVWI